jgi:hypothetical protein
MCRGEMMRSRYFALSGCILLSLSILQSCKKAAPATTAFYYWKSNFNLNAGQLNILKQAANSNLYIRFFDVKWDADRELVKLNAVVNFKQSATVFEITPVVFITNTAFEHTSVNATDSLAVKVYKAVNTIAKTNHVAFKSIQIDCDWTLGTKDKYFAFLKSFKVVSRKELSATIRLHQVKYKARTGVPPIDKGTLMFYNVGQINADLHENNSIYNEKDAGRYIEFAKHYPLPLDIALPLFSWSILIRDGRVIQVYGNISRDDLKENPNFEAMKFGYKLTRKR